MGVQLKRKLTRGWGCCIIVDVTKEETELLPSTRSCGLCLTLLDSKSTDLAPSSRCGRGKGGSGGLTAILSADRAMVEMGKLSNIDQLCHGVTTQ